MPRTEKSKTKRAYYLPGGRFDPNVDHFEDIKKLFAKKCSCKGNCLKKLNDWLLEKEHVDERMNRFELFYKKFACGSHVERADNIYIHLLSTMDNDKIRYSILNQPLCRLAFEILFCSSNFLTN